MGNRPPDDRAALAGSARMGQDKKHLDILMPQIATGFSPWVSNPGRIQKRISHGGHGGREVFKLVDRLMPLGPCPTKIQSKEPEQNAKSFGYSVNTVASVRAFFFSWSSCSHDHRFSWRAAARSAR
jgi:hypothetical protein